MCSIHGLNVLQGPSPILRMPTQLAMCYSIALWLPHTHTHHTPIHANTLTNTPHTYTKIHIHIYTHIYIHKSTHIHTQIYNTYTHTPTCHRLHTYTLYTCTLHPPHVPHTYTHTHHCKVLLSLVKRAGSIWGAQGTPVARFPP